MIHLTAASIALMVVAGFFASAVNAIAGGGSLISFPALLLVGYPAVVANMTNTVALVPGYLSATSGARGMLAGQRSRIQLLAPVGVAGAVLGAFLLTRTSADSFRGVVPWLILAACALLAAEPALAPRIKRERRSAYALGAVVGLQFLSGVYGGFFGAGLGVMLLATLGLFLGGSFQHLNALKQLLSLLISVVAALWFAAFGPVAWAAAGLVGFGSLLGGVIGVVVARRMRPNLLRAAVIVFGIAIAIRLLI